MRRPWRVGVVIPTRDEEELLPRCLRAVDRAAVEVRRARPGTLVSVHVVLDRCTDRSPALVAAHPWARAVRIDAGLVGAARAAGVEHFARTATQPGRAWVASTDADSAVPPDWLVAHLEAADAGTDVLVGMVALDRAAADPTLLTALGPDTPVQDGHPHIYGANLGLTLAAYRTVGGFAPVPAHEDVGVVRRAREAGLVVHSPARPAVLTSPRLGARAPEGLAAYLRALLDGEEASAS